MKKNKITLLSFFLFLSYDIYLIGTYLYYLFNKTKFGNVYKNILIYPHFAFMMIGTILNLIYYFKPNKWIKISFILSYIIAAILLIF